MKRIKPTMSGGLTVLLLIAVGLTIATFYSFIIPEDRGEAFYSGIFACCIAEVVLFYWLRYTLAARSVPDHPDLAVRMRLMLLVVGWTLVILVTSSVAADPDNADTFFTDKIIIFQLIITFLAFGAFFFQYRQAVALQIRDDVPQHERRRLESCAGGLDPSLADLRALASREPDHAVALEGLAKRIDTLKTQLQSASANTSGDRYRPVNPADAGLIEERLNELHDELAQLLSASGEQLADKLEKVRSTADRVLATLRQREDAVTF